MAPTNDLELPLSAASSSSPPGAAPTSDEPSTLRAPADRRWTTKSTIMAVLAGVAVLGLVAAAAVGGYAYHGADPVTPASSLSAAQQTTHDTSSLITADTTLDTADNTTLDSRPCVIARRTAHRTLNGAIDTLTRALTRYLNGAPILRLASIIAERALAVAENALAEAIETLDALLGQLRAAQTDYDTLMNGDWNTALTECAGSDQEETCRTRLADVNARRNELAAVVSDADAAVLAQQDIVDDDQAAVNRLRLHLQTVEAAEQAGLLAFQSAVRVAAAAEKDAFVNYKAAVVACKPNMDGGGSSEEEDQMLDLHDSVQLQLAAAGAASTVAPDDLAGGGDPLNPDWEADAVALNITTCDGKDTCSTDLSTCTLTDKCWHSCPVKIRAAWLALRSRIATAKTSLTALKVGAAALQRLVDTAKAAMDEAWAALAEALAALKQARAVLQQAIDAQKVTQTAYEDAIQEKATVEKRCQAAPTADPCSTAIQDATLAYNGAATENADKVQAVLDARDAVDRALAAVKQIRIRIKVLTAALKTALSEQQTKLQGWQDAINAAIAAVHRASRTYRRTLRSCNHRANAATVDALATSEHWTEEIFKKNATTAQVEVLIELLSTYADAVAEKMELPTVCTDAQKAALVACTGNCAACNTTVTAVALGSCVVATDTADADSLPFAAAAEQMAAACLTPALAPAPSPPPADDAPAAALDTANKASSLIASKSARHYLKTIRFSSDDNGYGDIRKGSNGASIFPTYEWTTDASQAVRRFALASGSHPIGSTDAPQCPSGFELIEYDLNQGTDWNPFDPVDSNFNYLCLGRQGGSPVTDVTFLIMEGAFDGWRYNDWTVSQNAGDLLATSGGKYVYVGYKTADADPLYDGAERVVHQTRRDISKGGACYELSGGMQKELRGTYTRVTGPTVATTPTCRGQSVYQNGEFYLYAGGASDGDWHVTNEALMNDCDTKWIPNDPGSYLATHDVSRGHGSEGNCRGGPDCVWCAGTWVAHTGAGTMYEECEASYTDVWRPGWCPTPNVQVTAC